MLGVEDYLFTDVDRRRIERVYSDFLHKKVEPSYTESNVKLLNSPEKHRISSDFILGEFFINISQPRKIIAALLCRLQFRAMLANIELVG